MLTVLILLYSCEKDGSLEETTAVKISQLEGKILTKQELLESNKKMAKVLERYEKPLSTHAANRTIDSNHYKILYDEIKYLENGDYHSYTFGIESNGPTGIVQNLLLSYQSDGTYKAFIVTYKLTQHEQDAILEGKKVNLEGKFSIGIIDSDISLILNKSQYVFDGKCPPGKCCEVEGTSRATGWEILKIVSCIPSGGGSGDSGGTGTLDWPEYEDPGTDAGIDDNGSGETTGGGGGTSTGGDTSNDDPSCIADSNGDCIGDTTTPLIPKPTAATKLITYLGIDRESQEAYWLNNVASEAEIMELHKFLSNNDFTQNAKDFALEATRVAMKYPDFDMDIARSFDSPYNVDLSKVKPSLIENEPEKEKFMFIYDKITKVPVFKDLFLETFGDNNKLNVSFEIVESIPSDDDPNSEANGKTLVKKGSTNPSTGAINSVDLVIQINKKDLAGLERKSLISIAKTILHESVHPYLIIKQLNSNSGATLFSLNNKDLGELINDEYNGFESDEDQHAFMYDKLLPVLSKNLSYLKDELIPYNHQELAESLNFKNAYHDPPIPDTPFNWDDLFLYLSMGGLERTQVMNEDVLLNPVKKYIYQRYLELGEDSFRKDL